MSLRGFFVRHRLKLRIIFSVIGICVGFSACVAFALKFNNLHSSIWAGVSSILASFAFFLHASVMRDAQKRSIQPSSFVALMIIGVVGLLAGVMAFIAYIIAGKIRHEEGVHAKGFYIVTVWAFMTFKWGLLLFLYARKYKVMFHNMNPISETSGIINS